MRAPIVVPAESLRGSVGPGRSVTVRKPAAGASDAFRVGPGETLDLSQIANENITLVKLGARLVVLFPDRAFVVVDGLYLPSGSVSQGVRIGLDGSTTLDSTQFVAQFPISSDEQVLTAAGIAVGPRGSGGINLASAPPSSSLPPLSPLTGDEGGESSSFTTLLSNEGEASGSRFATTAASAAQSGIVAANDVAAVVEAGVGAGNVPSPGIPAATGNVLANDSGADIQGVVGVAFGVVPIALGNVGTAIAGTYGTLTLAADGSYAYALDNADGDTQALVQGAAAQEVFTYTAADSLGGISTATLTIAVTGANDAPALDLDTGAAGTGYQGLVAAEAARSVGTVVASNGVSVVQTLETSELEPRPHAVLITDPEAGDLIRSITVAVGDVASGQKGALVLTAATLATLAGVSVVVGDGTAALTITSTGAGFNAGEAAAIIAGVRFVNTELTFALDIADRAIAVTVTDLAGASAAATGFVPIIADVTDATGLDRFTGTRFDDTIRGLGGSDRIDAGSGNDTIVYRMGDGADALIDGGAGDDRLRLEGTLADDLFHVRASGGALVGLTSGGDALPAGDNVARIEHVVLDGQGSLGDTLSYAGNLEAVSVDLVAGTATGFESIANIENATGGTLRDLLVGDAQANILDGREDNDRLFGGGGDDQLFGGAGDDLLVALDGDDLIDTGSGDNVVQAGAGDNTIAAYDGDDDITSGDGDDVIDAGGGDNTVASGGGDDLVTLGDGSDVVDAGSGDNIVRAGDGDDRIATGSGDDRIESGAGDDRITTGGGLDVLVIDGDLAAIGADTLTDFETGADILEFDHLSTGNGLAVGGADTGDLDPSRFVAGANYTDTDQRFLFDPTSGILYYDADGIGGAEASIALAQLEAGAVSAGDIRLS